jgi:hypothetical protein
MLTKDICTDYWSLSGGFVVPIDRREPSWPKEALARGVMHAAVEALGAIVAETATTTRSSVAREGSVWTMGPLRFRGLRTLIIGCEEASQAARDELLRRILDRSREALCLCILPDPNEGVWPILASEPQMGAAGVIAFFRSDIDALCEGRLTLIELIDFKLQRRLIFDIPDPGTQYQPAIVEEYRRGKEGASHLRQLSDSIAELSEDPNEWLIHPLSSRIQRTLENGRGCLLVGPSSSGKSVLSFQIGTNLHLAGNTAYYLNLGSVSSHTPNALEALSSGSTSERPSILILDDLQSNPGAARYFLAVANLLRRSCEHPSVAVLGVSWPGFAAEAAGWHEDCLPVAVQSSQIREAIIREHGTGLADEILIVIRKQFGDDLVLLRLSLQQARKLGGPPILSSVAEEIWRQRTASAGVADQEAERTALIVGSLGRFDINAPEPFVLAEAQVSGEVLERLVQSRLLRRQRAFLSMGHRSLCALLTDWLAHKDGWQHFGRPNSPKNTAGIVLDYLKSLGSGLTVDSLRALRARAGLKDKPKLSRHTLAVVSIWQAFDAIVERIERQQERDPTWKGSASSAMFAIQAMAEVGKQELAKGSLSFLRQHWQITPLKDAIRISTKAFTTRYDFEGIRKAMLREDDEQPPSVAGWTPAKEIDFERFQGTWLMGVVLCAEAAAQSPGTELLSLAEVAERQQLETGSFYPERVPWATARVLLGLAACGRTVDTSNSVQRAVRWFLHSHEDGGPMRGGIWASGTGEWNTDLEATCMVLLSLAAVGYDCSDERLSTARSYILSERARWAASGRELDGALAIQAFLDTGGAWEDVVEEAQRLSQWARGEALWAGATITPKQSLEQSCRVAQIGAHLVSIGWTAIRSDLPAFLDSLSTPQKYEEYDAVAPAAGGVPAADHGASTETIGAPLVRQPTADAVLECLRNLSALSLSEAVVVGRYLRHDERTRNRLRDWCGRISAALVEPTDSHENFLIWAAPGSGKTFLVEQLAESLAPAVTLVTINLADLPRNELVSRLDLVRNSRGSVLCLLDEIDSRADEDWPLQEIYPVLDVNRFAAHGVVCVLIGSSTAGLESMTRRIEARWKGRDLLDRIPADRRFELDTATFEDRAIVVAGQMCDTAIARGQSLKEIEKLALYYTLSNQDLKSPRQLSDLARDAVRRLSIHDDRLRYDNLFEPGNSRNQRFWVEHQDAAAELAGVFVRVLQ